MAADGANGVIFKPARRYEWTVTDANGATTTIDGTYLDPAWEANG